MRARRVLKVRGHRDDGVAAGLGQRIKAGANRAEVARVHDYFHPLILRCELSQNRHRVIPRSIVDEDHLKLVALQLIEHGFDLRVEFLNIVLLVVTTSNNANHLRAH